MAQLVPFLSKMEHGRIKTEIQGASHLVVIFDGTTYNGEAFAILLRFIDDNSTVVQCLVRIHVLAKSLSGMELARKLVACLSFW